MKSRSYCRDLVRKRDKLIEVLLGGSKENPDIAREPLVLLAGDDELLDVGFAIGASEPVGARRSRFDQMKFVADILGFGGLTRDAIDIGATDAVAPMLVISRYSLAFEP